MWGHQKPGQQVLDLCRQRIFHISGCKAFCLDILHNVLFGEEGFPDLTSAQPFIAAQANPGLSTMKAAKDKEGWVTRLVALFALSYAQTKVFNYRCLIF